MIRFRFLLCLAAAFASAAARAQSQTPPPAAPQQQAQPQLDGVALAILIKSAVVALQQANATGNYSVLRDLGTPLFRERFDQVKLADIFANLRNRKINLSPVLMLNPSLTKQPELTPDGKLHLVGIFPAQPLQIQYELLLLQIDGIWRIEGIAVDATAPQQAPQASASPPPVAAAPPSAPQKPSKPAKDIPGKK